MKKLFLLFLLIPVFVFAEPMYSPTWGFFIDLPEGYEFADGDGRDRFSFEGPGEFRFDMVVYNGRFNSLQDLTNDVNRRLSNRGDVDFFIYNGKQAAIMRLEFGDFEGWGLVVELDSQPNTPNVRPMLLALAYGPEGMELYEIFHLSALDSIAPTFAERRYPGPITEYSFPRGNARNTPLAIRGLNAMIRENDAEAAQVLIEREFAIYSEYLNTPFVYDAAARYYRFIFRDSYDRISDAVMVITQHFGGHAAFTDEQKRVFAQRVLTFIQGFEYERDLSGSDFNNLVTAITEGRGDCDPRSVLYALILNKVNIPSGIMLSYHYSHAMGLMDITGIGTRIQFFDQWWMVAETTIFLDVGQITEDMSDYRHWFPVFFD